jgi:hypothetical protein
MVKNCSTRLPVRRSNPLPDRTISAFDKADRLFSTITSIKRNWLRYNHILSRAGEGAQLAAGSAAAGMLQGLAEDASPIRRP